MMLFRRDIYYNQDLTLAWLLNQSIYFESTNPRDKIFALLGLATDDSSRLIIPDYRASTRSVYIKTMHYLLRQAKEPLVLLYGAGIGLQRKILDLPSWVPDWSCVLRSQYEPEKYSPNSTTKSSVRFDEDLTTLRLDGKIFDKIVHLGPVNKIMDMGIAHSDEPMIVRKWLVDMERLAVHAKDPYHNGEPRIEALFRTMVGNESYDKNDPPTDMQCREDYMVLKAYLDKYPLWIRQKEVVAKAAHREYLAQAHGIEEIWDSMLDLESQYSRISTRIGAACGSRMFCVTKEGRIGIVPEGCLIGDMICTFDGGRMPFLLRPKDITNYPSYELVGCCYIHGVINGEEKVGNVTEIVLV
jgi:hypothetical protein